MTRIASVVRSRRRQGALDGEAHSTVWRRSVRAQLSRFLSTETGSSGVLVAAIVAAMIWANLPGATYQQVWSTPLTVRLGAESITMPLTSWVSQGLMTLFFLTVGLEARRELDLGSLRTRRDFLLPGLAGVIGMAVPIAVFLTITAGSPASRGWAIAMSTDTALALGLLSLVTKQLPERIRGFLLTLFIVDDVGALLVIAVAYTSDFRPWPLLAGAVTFAASVVLRRGRNLAGAAALAGVVAWLLVLESGVDPLVVGLATGLSVRGYSPDGKELEDAARVFRRFREQPTARFANDASHRLQTALSANDRLQSRWHPWAAYVVVPLFAFTNAGVRLDATFARDFVISPLPFALVLAYVAGKPIAVLSTSWVITAVSRGQFRPPVGWGAVAVSGTIAGVGFTVSVLVANLVFTGPQLSIAKASILLAVILSTAVTAIASRVLNALPEGVRTRALLGSTADPLDLIAPVDRDRDHIRGSATATITIVEYGDFQCPYCGRAEPSVRELTERLGLEVQFVWRHLPLGDVHPHAQQAAEAAEAAAAQGQFWAMHDLLLAEQSTLDRAGLLKHARRLGLNLEQFTDDLARRRWVKRIEEDVSSADASGVSGTPTFFINGRRHYGPYDVEALRAAIDVARQRSLLDVRKSSPVIPVNISVGGA